MNENNSSLYNKVRYSLINLDKSNNNLKYEQLFTLYDSVMNSKSNKTLSNSKISNNTNNITLTSKKDYYSKNHNLINEIINDKLNTKKTNLFHKNYKMKHNKSSENKKQLIKNKNNNFNAPIAKTFITNTFIQTTQTQKPNMRNNTENKNYVFLGKSINDILIKSINDEMINKGILIQRPISTKKNNKNEKIDRHNYNNYETHLDIFSQKLKKEFSDYLNEVKLAKKKSLRSLSRQIADKKEKMTKNIPIYVKGFKKDSIDIFHSRKIFDLEYQKIYRKPSVNIEEILHYQNKNGSNNFKKGKIPFYYFLRTVNNPYDKIKLFKKRPKSGKIYIEYNGEGQKN